MIDVSTTLHADGEMIFMFYLDHVTVSFGIIIDLARGACFYPSLSLYER